MVTDFSIIIVSYNHFETTTGPCLESLSAVQEPLLEIIVVDNGSDQESIRQLQRAANTDARVKLLLNGENKGFAAANNDGVELATAEYILLLNSDTLVPENAPGLLLRHLMSAKGPCVVGPVTNSAGNEQQICIRANRDATSILSQGKQWSDHAHGSVFETGQLSFFCVAMAAKIYRDLGGLDPSFGLGFYEDADFCCRAVEKGVSLQVMEECFVFHQGSASFSRIPDSVKKLLAVNRKLFRARHGRNEGVHPRWKNFLVLQGYLKQAEKSGFLNSYLFANRMKRARELVPNNPLKKIAYSYRLNQLSRAASRFRSTDKQ